MLSLGHLQQHDLLKNIHVLEVVLPRTIDGQNVQTALIKQPFTKILEILAIHPRTGNDGHAFPAFGQCLNGDHQKSGVQVGDLHAAAGRGNGDGTDLLIRRVKDHAIEPVIKQHIEHRLADDLDIIAYLPDRSFGRLGEIDIPLDGRDTAAG